MHAIVQPNIFFLIFYFQYSWFLNLDITILKMRWNQPYEITLLQFPHLMFPEPSKLLNSASIDEGNWILELYAAWHKSDTFPQISVASRHFFISGHNRLAKNIIVLPLSVSLDHCALFLKHGSYIDSVCQSLAVPWPAYQ
jgi:hypothetical protein